MSYEDPAEGELNIEVEWYEPSAPPLDFPFSAGAWLPLALVCAASGAVVGFVIASLLWWAL